MKKLTVHHVGNNIQLSWINLWNSIKIFVTSYLAFFKENTMRTIFNNYPKCLKSATGVDSQVAKFMYKGTEISHFLIWFIYFFFLYTRSENWICPRDECSSHCNRTMYVRDAVLEWWNTILSPTILSPSIVNLFLKWKVKIIPSFAGWEHSIMHKYSMLCTVLDAKEQCIFEEYR